MYFHNLNVYYCIFIVLYVGDRNKYYHMYFCPNIITLVVVPLLLSYAFLHTHLTKLSGVDKTLQAALLQHVYTHLEA